MSETAALFHLPTDVCLAFPGATGEITSSAKVEVMALYETREDAEAMASSLE